MKQNMRCEEKCRCFLRVQYSCESMKWLLGGSNSFVRKCKCFASEHKVAWRNTKVLRALKYSLAKVLRSTEKILRLLAKALTFFFFLLSTPYYFYISRNFATQHKYFSRDHKWHFSTAWYDSVWLTFVLFTIGYIQGRVILLGNIGCKPRAPNTRGAPGKILLFHIIRNRPVLKASEKSSI